MDGFDFHLSRAEPYRRNYLHRPCLFVFFRRAVWRKQEKRGSGLLSLDLNRPRNNLAPDYVLENESTNVFLEPDTWRRLTCRMISFLFLMLLYFLPAILGRDKSHATGIFLLNLFLGWTLIDGSRRLSGRSLPTGGIMCLMCL